MVEKYSQAEDRDGGDHPPPRRGRRACQAGDQGAGADRGRARRRRRDEPGRSRRRPDPEEEPARRGHRRAEDRAGHRAERRRLARRRRCIGVQTEIRKLKASATRCWPRCSRRRRASRIQEQLDGLSVDAEVKALDNVREHIKTRSPRRTSARSWPTSSLDSRLAALRNQVGDVQAKQQLAELKAAARPRRQAVAQKTDVSARRIDQLRKRVIMKLTPFAKLFITLVVLGVVGYATWHYKGARRSASGRSARPTRRRPAPEARSSAATSTSSRTRRPIPTRDAGVDRRHRRRSPAPASSDRPLVVGINTWAGHAPGIVFNDGMDPDAASSYKKKYGLDVKFVLLEDPAAKLAAFRKGDVDIMWNTVDNWAREASILAEQNQKAKSIIMQDWSRGGDGIVSLAIDQVDRRSEGPQDRLHAVHAVALPAALPAVAVGPLARRPRRRSRRTSSSRRTRRPPPRCSRPSRSTPPSRGSRISRPPSRRAATRRTCWSRRTAATNIIADTLVRAAGRDRQGAGDACATSCTAGSTASR